MTAPKRGRSQAKTKATKAQAKKKAQAKTKVTKAQAKTGANKATGPKDVRAQMRVWESIVDRAVTARTKQNAQQVVADAEALAYLPVDLFPEDPADGAAFDRAHASMNDRLRRRIGALGPGSAVADVLCVLRDLINTT